jgi:aspartate carbamoyltransferase catalytic subunit
MSLKGRSILEAQIFTLDIFDELFDRTSYLLDRKPAPIFRDDVVVMLFYQPSTRTRMSFQIAAVRLGADVIYTEDAGKFSSAAKGEILEDTTRVVAGYRPRALVLRHHDDDAAHLVARNMERFGVPVPVFNAGCGAEQHPTQAALDLYSIRRELGRTDNVEIAFVGDCRYSRTVRSLAYLMAKHPGTKIHFVSVPELRVRQDITAYLHRHGVSYTETEDWSDLVPRVDILYMTRPQKEWFGDTAMFDRVKDRFVLDVPTARRMKSGAKILHPLPRNNEIALEVDALPQAAYFRQSDYGPPLRTALFEMVCGP